MNTYKIAYKYIHHTIKNKERIGLKEQFNLFDTDADKPIIPLFDQGIDDGVITSDELRKQLNGTESLKSVGLERAISGDTVKSVMIPEDVNILIPNYVIDISKVKEVQDCQSYGIDALVSSDGDTVLYYYTKEGLARIGYGKSRTLDRILAIVVRRLFGSECKVYKDLEVGKPLKLVSRGDATTLRLDL